MVLNSEKMLNKNLINSTLAVVCARGGSKGLKGKNYIELKKTFNIFCD